MQQTPLYFVYGYLASIAMILVGAVWSFSPIKFVKVYRQVVPFKRVLKRTDWEKPFRSLAGRTIGFLIAVWGLWIVLLLSAQIIRLHYHLKETSNQQTLSTELQQGPGWNAVTKARKPVVL